MRFIKMILIVLLLKTKGAAYEGLMAFIPEVPI